MSSGIYVLRDGGTIGLVARGRSPQTLRGARTTIQRMSGGGPAHERWTMSDDPAQNGAHPTPGTDGASSADKLRDLIKGVSADMCGRDMIEVTLADDLLVGILEMGMGLVEQGAVEIIMERR